MSTKYNLRPRLNGVVKTNENEFSDKEESNSEEIDSNDKDVESEDVESEDDIDSKDVEDVDSKNVDSEDTDSDEVNSKDINNEDINNEDNDEESESDFIVGDYKTAYEELYDGWEEGLSKDEIEKYSKLVNQVKDKYTGFRKILKSNFLENDKELAIERAVVINQMLKDEHINEDFFLLQNKLVKSIKVYENYTIDELNNYKTVEDKLVAKMDNHELRFKILDLKIPDIQKVEILKRFHQLQDMCQTSDDYAKLKGWIDIAMSLPWNKFTSLPVTYDSPKEEKLEFVKTTLEKWDKKQGYVQAAKEEMILNLIDLISTKKMEGINTRPKILTLRGSPGVGKTLFLQSLAEILGLGIKWIDFSGATDPSMIRGSGYTYVGSQPGRIIKGAIEIGAMNGIIVLEEIDKIVQGSSHQNKVENTLVSLLDRTRSDWIDDYLEFPFDISNYIFVTTINDEKLLTDPLRNRLHIIEFPAYDMQQKIQLSKQFEIPKALNIRGINPDEFIISDHIIEYISNKMEKEDGMRNLKRAIDSVIQRANFYFQLGDNATNINVKFGINDFKIPFVLTEKHVDIFLEHLKPTNTDWKRIYM
jgi:ATP-dependent Lon protease